MLENKKNNSRKMLIFICDLCRCKATPEASRTNECDSGSNTEVIVIKRGEQNDLSIRPVLCSQGGRHGNFFSKTSRYLKLLSGVNFWTKFTLDTKTTLHGLFRPNKCSRVHFIPQKTFAICKFAFATQCFEYFATCTVYISFKDSRLLPH